MFALRSLTSVASAATRALYASASTRAAWSPLVAARTTIALSPLSRMAPTRAYQVRASIKPRCQHCYDAMRKGRRYILCKKNPKHKQRQG